MKVPRVELSGGIGAGKTTLARLLAEAGLQLVVEEVRTVPFFAEFYAEPERYAFEKNVSFLLSHANRIREAAATAAAGPGNGGPAYLACDYALFQDLAYTDIACSPADVRAVETVFERMVARVGHPALLVHLGCSPDTQLKRIARRARPEEVSVSRGYLAALCAAVDRRRAELLVSVPGLPVVEFDTDALDWAERPDDRRTVRDRVLAALHEARRSPVPATDPLPRSS